MGLESGKDKVKKLCDILKRETLEPARHEADEIVAAARQQAEEILADAHQEAKRMADNAVVEIEKLRATFQASLTQACRQAVEALKEKIEKKLFSPALASLVAQPLQDPKLIAGLINAIVKGIEKEGTQTEISAIISSTVSARAVNELLASEVLQRLKEKGVLLSTMGGGIEIKLHKNHITIDLTDETIRELIAAYTRKDFREFVFG